MTNISEALPNTNENESNTFSEIEHVDWLVDPEAAHTYIQYVFDRHRQARKEGSILPLPLARLNRGNRDPQEMIPVFDLLSSEVLSASGFEARTVRPIKHHTPDNRIDRSFSIGKHVWHVDRFPDRLPHSDSYMFGFLYSPNEDPLLNTRYATPGSSINRRLIHLQPEPEHQLESSGDVVYLVPANQTLHAPPEGNGTDDQGHFIVRYADIKIR